MSESRAVFSAKTRREMFDYRHFVPRKDFAALPETLFQLIFRLRGLDSKDPFNGRNDS
jgi:hypothetical protein